MAKKITRKDYDKIWSRRVKNKIEQSNYFDKQKKKSKPYFGRAKPHGSNLYFDCETYEYYDEPNNPKEQPEIIPYAVGWTTDEPNTYKSLFGEDVSREFIEQALMEDGYQKRQLLAYNIDYDFQVLRHSIVKHPKKKIKISYTMTDDKKFIFGELNVPSGAQFKIIDLWRWNQSMGLALYMQHISNLVYDDKGNIKDEPVNDQIKGSFSKDLGEVLTKFGFTKDTFKKLTIDYRKVNLHKADDGNYYYWNSKEDWIANKPPILLDKEAELKYLRIDVLALPIVYAEQQLFRKYIKLILGITRPIDKDTAISLPGFAKYLCEEFTQKYLLETVRRKVHVQDYKHECKSYIGAFVGGHKDITYIDEETFKEKFPGVPLLDEEGKYRIKSYDVNSMYPWAMSTGLPHGEIWDIPVSKNCVEWVEIHFKDWWNKDNPDKKRRLYDWKPKYAFLNNSFFGDNFAIGLTPGLSANNRVYVLRQTLDLFYEMCDAHVEEVASRYQDMYTELNPFIDKLYEIKVNKGGKWPKSTVAMIKLVLNSLYGKMCEKYKLEKIVWCNDFKELCTQYPEWVEDLIDQKLIVVDNLKNKPTKPTEVLTPEDQQRQDIKNKFSPYIDRENECGYFYMENTDKRFDCFGNDCRESILAGAYITYLSRWKLLSAVKQEVDNGNIVLYCDTDSIKFIQFNKPKFETHESKLGAWKDEGSYPRFMHVNKLKKYVMHNPYETNPKKRWMVKTSGIPESALREPNKEFDWETLKVVYNEENRVLIKGAKRVSQKNHLYQSVILDTDFKFVFKDPKAKPTHVMKDGILTVYEEN